MKNAYSVVLASFLILLSPLASGPTARAEDLAPLHLDRVSDQVIDDLETTLPPLIEAARVPGLQIAVIRDGKVVWTQGFGVKNTESGEPVTANTIFEAASLTKPLFAYAVMKLVEEGTVDLDVPIHTYLSSEEIEGLLQHPVDFPEFKRDWFEAITARHVLSHSGGMPHGEGGRPYPVLFEPGTEYKYSADGYYLLQLAVAKLKGERLDATIQSYVLDPLGMTESCMVWREEYEAVSASGHGYFGKPEEFRKRSDPHSAASLYTTAADYARFVCAVLNGDGITRETLAEMLTPQITVDEETGLTWSLGFALQEDANGKAFWQWGDYGIFRNYILAYPESRSGIVYLTNSYYGLGICRKVVAHGLGGNAWGVQFLGYLPYDSPIYEFAWVLQERGPDAVSELLPDLKERYPEEFEESTIGNMGRTFADEGLAEESIALFDFNVKEYPQSPRANADLARGYLQKGDLQQARHYYDRALEVNSDDEFDTKFVDWALSYIKALEEPAVLPEGYLKTLAGDYETRHIKFEDGALHYFREGTSSANYRKLIPLSRDTFVVNELIIFRLRFEMDENGRPEKIVGLYEWGYQDQSLRDE
jgi:CubicO group peptidase (beta-lactamase class C family)